MATFLIVTKINKPNYYNLAIKYYYLVANNIFMIKNINNLYFS